MEGGVGTSPTISTSICIYQNACWFGISAIYLKFRGHLVYFGWVEGSMNGWMDGELTNRTKHAYIDWITNKQAWFLWRPIVSR